ncbi:MAG: site-2 protease family protein [Planctomycetota bacterium]
MDSCLILAESFWLQPSNYFAILKVLLGLGAVIFVHELGHFLVAKLCGVKCEKFYVGFDVPIRLFGRTLIPGKLVSFQWGETEYGIGAIPLGGYVKMLGQDDNPGNVEEQIEGSLVDGETVESAMLESGLVDQSKLDPRSYMAKSVLQRMAIISAGVIFNLAFAVLFAAIAFRSGVDYEPAVLGNSIGGGPAWKHDLAGAQVVAIGDRKIEGYFPFSSFVEQIIFNGDEQEIELTIVPNEERDGNANALESDPPKKTKVVKLIPKKGFRRENPDFAVVGISGSQVPIIGTETVVADSAASKANPPLELDDRVLEVNNTKVQTEIDLRQILTRDANLDAVFLLERTKDDGTKEQITSTMPPMPFHDFGFSTGWGTIEVMRDDSPASDAGLELGDEIVSINGLPRGDLLTLDMQMVDALTTSTPVILQIKRGNEQLDIPITPVVPKLFATPGPNTPIAIDSLGVAIPMTHTIETVTSDSAADQAGLEAGDVLVHMNYLFDDKQKKDERLSSIVKRSKPQVKFLEGSIKTSWAEVFVLNLQSLKIGSKIELTVDRKSGSSAERKTVELTSRASEKFYQPTRGFYLKRLKFHYESENWADAFSNGGNQVVTDIRRVGKTLYKLVKGDISATNLGGPGTIAMVATSEATQGTSRLLLFLTFLSANLAIVNFLPIPVLDGGHMLFLTYEGLFRRPVNEKVQNILTWGGLFFVLALMIFVISLDIGRISAWMM